MREGENVLTTWFSFFSRASKDHRPEDRVMQSNDQGSCKENIKYSNFTHGNFYTKYKLKYLIAYAIKNRLTIRERRYLQPKLLFLYVFLLEVLYLLFLIFFFN